VVDADGLNIAAAQGVDWRRSGQPVVITPHPAEMARLAGSDTRAVQSRRLETASAYAASTGVVVVLKGAETVVAAPDGRVHVDRHRVVALATGGTGDVLAGLCGAMLAGHLEPFDAAVAAVTVHAEAGAAVQAERGRAGALAGDVLDRLPEAQERLRRALEAGR
jgi:NAD(P)H-hydrate epimerase